MIEKLAQYISYTCESDEEFILLFNNQKHNGTGTWKNENSYVWDVVKKTIELLSVLLLLYRLELLDWRPLSQPGLILQGGGGGHSAASPSCAFVKERMFGLHPAGQLPSPLV